jgi:hypothetical protein
VQAVLAAVEADAKVTPEADAEATEKEKEGV